MRIAYEMHSDNPKDQELVARYWALNERGTFVEQVSDLLPLAAVSSSQSFLKYLNEISSAWDTAQTCDKCGNPHPIRSRSDFLQHPVARDEICPTCLEDEREEAKCADDVAEAKLREQLDQITADNLLATISYASIADDIALILIALDKAISPRLQTGVFMLDQCCGLVPAQSNSFVQRLWDAGVIVDLPTEAVAGAYHLKDEEVCRCVFKLAYFLVPDKDRGKGDEAFRILSARIFHDYQSLRRLWLDYAVSDCMAYLDGQCELRALYTTDEAKAEIESILRNALQKYCVAQLWFVLWIAVQEAAKLSIRPYYSNTKAAATIPVMIKGYLEKASRGQLAIKSWRRPGRQRAGTLGDVLCEYFGIDEGTSGIEVMSKFLVRRTSNNDLDHDRSAEELDEQACLLTHRAIAHNREFEVFFHFANYIRSGADVGEALDLVFATVCLLDLTKDQDQDD